MSLLFIDSFDHYQTSNVLSKWTRDSGITANWPTSAIQVGGGRCGSNCLWLREANEPVKGLVFGSNRGTIGFAAYFEENGDTAGDDITDVQSVIRFATVGDASGYHLWLLQNPDGSLEVQRAPGTSLGVTLPGLVNENHWYFIEWQVFIHPTIGEVIVRLNNTEVLHLTAQNTIGAGRTETLRQLGFHCGVEQSWRLDDLYVLDSTGLAPLNTFLGDCRVEYLRPNGAGSLQQWSVVGAPSHWEAVDDNDTPDDEATRVESSVVNQTDTNNYANTALPSGTIFGAQVSLYARKSDSGPRVIAPVVAGELSPSPPITNVSQSTYQYHHTPYGNNPATNAPWTISDVNAVQVGVTVVS